jgi:hypothetical protein
MSQYLKAALGFCLLCLFGCASAQAASAPPSVTSEAASSITTTDATLEAQIDPGSAVAGARYQFQIAESPAGLADEMLCPPPSGPIACIGNESAEALPIRFIAHEDGSTLVSLDLAGAGVVLQPGKTYYYRVLAASSKASEDTVEWEEPTIFGATESFVTSSCSSSSGSEPSGGSASGSSGEADPVGPSPALPPRHHHRHHRRHHVWGSFSAALATAVRAL